MSYEERSLEELRKLARKRRVDVINPATKTHQHLKKGNFLAVLKAADSYNDCTKAEMRTFTGFMDLPPELRNQVYNELLTFQDSFSCFPEILAVSMTINEEATSLLYANNLVEIKFWYEDVFPNEGVYVHGKRVGPFPKEYAWPEYVKHVEHLRLSLGQDSRAFGMSHARMVEFEDDILRSLCEFLAPGHKLKSLHIDFPSILLDGDQQPTAVDIYLTRLLGDIRVLQSNGTSIEHRPSDPIPFDEAREMLAQAYREFLRVLDEELTRTLPPVTTVNFHPQSYDCHVYHIINRFQRKIDRPEWFIGGALGSKHLEKGVKALMYVNCIMSIRRYGGDNLIWRANKALMHRWIDAAAVLARR